MPNWTLLEAHPSQARTFQRPLDTKELVFLWNGLLDGTTDSIHHCELRLVNVSRDAHLFSEANIVRAWLSTKRRYPLVGATVEGNNLNVAVDSTAEGGKGDSGDNSTGFASQPHFVVREHDLSVLRPHELVFGEVTDAEEAQRHVAAMFNGPRLLSEDLLAQLYIFRETDSGRTDVLHSMVLIAHCITDKLASDTFMRCLLDTLARGEAPDSEPPQVPLEDRLAMSIPLAELEPMHLRSLSPAIRRWRRAAGAVIAQLRRRKLQGGHTLPRRVTCSTPHILPRSDYVSTSFTHAQTVAIFANCRLHNITFGTAYLPLAQVAMARVLYRRYLRGEISDEEWAYRRIQPHITTGPANLRPYLDKAWFDRGGGGEFMVSIHFLYCQLPFMTLGATAELRSHCKDDWERVLSDGAPPFSNLLAFDRFLHRAALVKKQMTAYFSHPLLFEIVHAESLSHVAATRRDTLRWMKRVEAVDDNGMHRNKDEILSVMHMPTVFAHGGSSYGNEDLTCPSEYPIAPTHPLSPYSSVPHPTKPGYITPLPPSSSPFTSGADTTPKIIVESFRSILHARPSELYLGAYTFLGQLSMVVYFDGNVFEEGVVREWLDEIRGAILWYLGRAHPESRHARQSRADDDDKQAGVGESVRSKL